MPNVYGICSEYAYRVIDFDNTILWEGSNRGDAVRIASANFGSELETRRQDYDGPPYDGTNYGLLRWMRCEQF